MNTNKPLDRRVQRTRPLLQEALFSLIIARGYEHITIADITEQANLGRTTFYLHYRDKEDLLQESIKRLVHDLHLDVDLEMENTCTYSRVSVRIFQHINQRKLLYQAMLKEAGPTRTLEDVLHAYFADLCQQFLPASRLQTQGPPLISNEVIAAHAAGSLLSLLAWWLKQETPLSAEDMGMIYCQLMAKGTGNLLTLF